ncbi:MAG TPA: hypothetical protein VHE30_21550 [Polyangiaceae bacterium]|nr:hypothetical protein [Polyangiaceae bacterium]
MRLPSPTSGAFLALAALATGTGALPSCANGHPIVRRAPDEPRCDAAVCPSRDAGTDARTPAASVDARVSVESGVDSGTPRARADAAPPTDSGTFAISACHAFTSDPMGCVMASPMDVVSEGAHFVLAPSTDGTLRALDPATGRTAWSIVLPTPTGQVADVTSPPALFDSSHLVVGFQHVDPKASYGRITQNVAVVDLEARALDPDFPLLTLDATGHEVDGGSAVPFSTPNTFGRSPLLHVGVPDRTRGLVYLGFGNQRDIQPWHGWLFELDLDAWKTSGAAAAVTGTLLVTPESDCGPSGASGSRDDVCGGGLWAPAGFRLHESASGFEVYVPTGNGQLDLARHDYANGILRVGRGLAFDPECDTAKCTPFDPDDPGETCLGSCGNLFVPRLLPGEAPVRPESGVCDGKTLLQCYAALDWDLGANTPVRVAVPGAPDVLVLPGKDGAVYLFDAEHFGTLYDRETVVSPCGTKTDTCKADWAGMMVTEPVVTTEGGTPLVMIPTFMFDVTHPAGVVALRIVTTNGVPSFEPAWQAPTFGSDESLKRFRVHPSRMTLTTLGGVPVVVLVDVSASSAAPGTLLVIRIRDGEILKRVPLEGRGNRYVLPLVLGDEDSRRVVVSSCPANPPSTGAMEAIDLRTTACP